MIHGHEVLQMMAGREFKTKEEIVKAINEQFGEEERFYTCSAENLTAAELVDFLEARGKFMLAQEGGITSDMSKVCNH